MSARTVVVTFTDTTMCAYVRGYGTRELLTSLRGRPPVWSATHRAWVTQQRTAVDLIALAESRGIDVETRQEVAR